MAVKQLRYIDDSALTIHKKRYGRGYVYFDEKGVKITKPSVLRRLRNLVIPPMWTDVQICKFKDGHIQAIGRDAKGRKQYIYHSEWERQRQEKKFAGMKDFGMAIVKMRKKVRKDIRLKRWSKEKILALVVMILDDTGIRIGNRQYMRKNGTYGLTTLRRKHMELKADELILSFRGKSGKDREVFIDDEELISHISASAELPGYELFRYKDDNGSFHNVDSQEVNEYISAVVGPDFSSKDFRTWFASRLAIDYYPQAIDMKADFPRRKFSNILLKMVAEELGNTPTVCKSYYIHPTVFREIDKQKLPNPNPFRDDRSDAGLSASEKMLLELI